MSAKFAVASKADSDLIEKLDFQTVLLILKNARTWTVEFGQIHKFQRSVYLHGEFVSSFALGEL
jgi:hypothetical protein